MFDIKIDERAIFTHGVERVCDEEGNSIGYELYIGLHYHDSGVFEGEVVGPCGFITFPNEKVLEMFAEQMSLAQSKLHKMT